MIRTHRPRGFAWNCATTFQQTPLFRDISYEDAEIAADAGERWEPDEEDFAPSERASKRRRIETLADDFLNGKQLRIHSARLNPRAVRNAVARSFPSPKDAWTALGAIAIDSGGDVLWEDVEDDREVLRAFIASNRDGRQGIDATVLDTVAEPVGDVVVTEVVAQASCGPKRRRHSARLSVGPSDEALRRAAKLRNRKLQRAATDLVELTQPHSCPRPVVAETQTQSEGSDSSIQETDSDYGPSPKPGWTSSKWIKSGAFEIRRKEVDEECSRDELGTSSMFAPSQRSLTRATARIHVTRSNTSQPSLNTAPAAATSIGQMNSFTSETEGRSESNMCHGVGEVGVEVAESAETTNGKASHHTALEGVGEETSSAPEPIESQPRGDSQTQLLQRQGIRAAPQKSSATMNEGTEPQQKPASLEPASLEATRVSPAIRASLLDSAQNNAGKQKKWRKTKSNGATATEQTRTTSTRRRSAPSGSQNAARAVAKLPEDQQKRMGSFRSGYTTVATNGASPFMFRKRASKLNNTDDPEVEPIPVPQPIATKTPRRPMFFLSSDSPHLARKDPAAANKAPMPPPHTPLVNEHLNDLLPKDTTSGSCSSSVKTALRDELQNSGAEISRWSGDAPSSQPEANAAEPRQQVDASHIADENEPVAEHDMAIDSQGLQPWIGTQAMLLQAKNDLFTSPEKIDSSLHLGDKTTPHSGSRGKSRTRRKPLQQLSQEALALPNTQALLNNWQGWSSVKKPVLAGERRSIGSPSIGKGSIKVIASDPVQSLNNLIDRRRSSLRYSMSFNDSPAKETDIAFSSNRPASFVPDTAHGEVAMSVPATQPPPFKGTSGDVASWLSFGVSSVDLPTPAKVQSQSRSQSQPDPFTIEQTESLCGTKHYMSTCKHAQTEGDEEEEDMLSTYQQAQLPEYHSQNLDRTITELASDVLGTGEGIKF